MVGRKCSFSMSMVSPDQVNSIIATLNNTSACGFDQIDTFIIKLIRPEVVPAITHILNLSIIEKKFPSTWKKSKIIPLHKKDDPLDPKNYRPVAIVPIIYNFQFSNKLVHTWRITNFFILITMPTGLDITPPLP